MKYRLTPINDDGSAKVQPLNPFADGWTAIECEECHALVIADR